MRYHALWTPVRLPIDLLAFVILLLRRRKPFDMAGVHWSLCSHRSHRKALRCWRWFMYDGYCHRHTQTCYASCTPTTHAT